MSAPCGLDEGTCLFAPDGTLYVAPPGSGGQITAYNPSGHLRSGWPVDAPDGANYNGAVGQGWEIAPDGSLLVTTPTAITDVEQSGQVRPGWPVALADGNSQILVESSGTIVVVRDNSTVGETWVYALTLANSTPLLWSTRIDGDVSAALATSDGTIFLGAITPVGPDGKGGESALTTIGSDGRAIASWTTSLDAIAVTPSGDLAVVAYDTKVTTTGMEEYNVLRTHVAVLDRTGKTMPGWPRVIEGPASAPAVGPDGSLYFVLGDTVATGSILALDSSGKVKAGWPAKLPSGYAGVAGDQHAGHTNVSQHPIVANELVYVATSSHATGGQMIAAFKTSAGDHGGWVYQVPAGSQLIGLPSVPPIGSPTGPLYVLEQTTQSTGAVVALGADGQVLPGWPYVFDPGPAGLTVLAGGDVGVYSLDFATVLTATGTPAH